MSNANPYSRSHLRVPPKATVSGSNLNRRSSQTQVRERFSNKWKIPRDQARKAPVS